MGRAHLADGQGVHGSLQKLVRQFVPLLRGAEPVPGRSIGRLHRHADPDNRQEGSEEERVLFTLFPPLHRLALGHKGREVERVEVPIDEADVVRQRRLGLLVGRHGGQDGGEPARRRCGRRERR